MARILITGGLGHIGSALIEKIPRKHDLVVVDNLLTQRYCSLFNCKRKFEFWQKDFAELSIDKISSFDIIIHLAAVVDAANSFNNKDIDIVNVEKTKELIDKLGSNQKFIFPSSTSVYGTSELLVDETTPINPQSPYAESKARIEEYLGVKHAHSLIYRFGTICGPSKGMRFQTAINKFCWQAAHSQPLTIWTDNYCLKRPYLVLSDAINAINLGINNNYMFGLFNVLTENRSTKSIVSEIQKYKHISFDWVDTPLLNQYSYIVSHDKISRLFGYKPRGSVNKEIYRTLRML